MIEKFQLVGFGYFQSPMWLAYFWMISSTFQSKDLSNGGFLSCLFLSPQCWKDFQLLVLDPRLSAQAIHLQMLSIQEEILTQCFFLYVLYWGHHDSCQCLLNRVLLCHFGLVSWVVLGGMSFWGRAQCHFLILCFFSQLISLVMVMRRFF